MGKEKDKSLIPIGHYCYKHDVLYDGPKLEDGSIPIVSCPYDSYKKIAGVSVPYCSFLEMLGWSNNWEQEEYEKLEKHFGGEDATFEALELDLLWDSCKECGENHEEDFDIDLDTKEGVAKLEKLDKEWMIKVKKLRNG